jgi:two-component sensor histidine kinase
MRDGRIKYVQEQCETFYNPEGKPLRSVGIVQDITDRKQAEEKIRRSLEEKEVLLREIHHRVKNNMQIVSSLLMLQSRNIEDKKYKDMFIDSQNRINSMALIHEKLYQSESIAQINFKEYISDIVSNIFESYSIKRNIKIDINVENIPIKIDYAVPCGLIINELVTNSLKYAFPDDRQGNIKISVKKEDNNMIRLSISDDGIGIPKDMDIRNTKSLGLHLVTALAEAQLHGQIILNREKGTEFQIRFEGAK